MATYETQLRLKDYETENQQTREKYGDILDQFNVPVPRPFPDESNDQFRRRALPLLQRKAPGFENVRIDDAKGTAFDLIERQIFDAAKREAQHPTQIPEGELREVVRKDHAGRPYFEFFGRPSAWLNQFTGKRSQVVGIKSESDHGYSPSNMLP
jgi:hypothetical protein